MTPGAGKGGRGSSSAHVCARACVKFCMFLRVLVGIIMFKNTQLTCEKHTGNAHVDLPA